MTPVGTRFGANAPVEWVNRRSRCSLCGQWGCPDPAVTMSRDDGHTLYEECTLYTLKCAYCTALSVWRSTSRHADVTMRMQDVNSEQGSHRRAERRCNWALGASMAGVVLSILAYFTQQTPPLLAVLLSVCCGVIALCLGTYYRWRRALVLKAWDRLAPDVRLTFDGLFERDVQ